MHSRIKDLLSSLFVCNVRVRIAFYFKRNETLSLETNKYRSLRHFARNDLNRTTKAVNS